MDLLVISCIKVEMLEEPIAKSRVGACEDCGAEVWISLVTDEYALEQKSKIVCMECMDNYEGKNWESPEEYLSEETKEMLRQEGIDI